MTTSPAAAAPTRRLEQVGLPQSSREIGAPRARARRQRKCRTLPNSDDRSVPQPPQRCASESKRLLCQCCGISDLLSMTPYLALARSAPAPAPSLRAGEADVSIDRLSSIVGPEPNLPTNNFAKTKMTTSPAAARRPGGSSRSVRLRAPGKSARLVRARDGSESVERCQIPMIVQCRSRRSAARARASASSVSAAEFPICCR